MVVLIKKKIAQNENCFTSVVHLCYYLIPSINECMVACKLNKCFKSLVCSCVLLGRVQPVPWIDFEKYFHSYQPSFHFVDEGEKLILRRPIVVDGNDEMTHTEE